MFHGMVPGARLTSAVATAYHRVHRDPANEQSRLASTSRTALRVNSRPLSDRSLRMNLPHSPASLQPQA